MKFEEFKENTDEEDLADLPQENADNGPGPVSPVDIRRYKDPAGLSVAELDLGLWYVENKTRLIQFGFFMVFLFAVFAWGYFLYQFGYYFIKAMPDARAYSNEVFYRPLVDYEFYENRAPHDLQLYPVKTIPGTLNKRDIIGQISNPNPNHSASFVYYFLNNDDKIGEAKGFVLPSETKNLLALGLDIPTSIGGLRLVIEDLQWKRVNRHNFGVWQDFYDSHLDFDFTNVVFAPSNTSSLTEKLPINSLSFHVANSTSYNYWNVPLIISLYSYSDMVSIASYELNDFESDSSREISFTWPGSLPKITEVKIVPNLDITKMDIYKDFDREQTIFR